MKFDKIALIDLPSLALISRATLSFRDEKCPILETIRLNYLTVPSHDSSTNDNLMERNHEICLF